jgi:hypothetical protein
MLWKKEKVISIRGLKIKPSMVTEEIVRDAILKKIVDLDKERRKIARIKPKNMGSIMDYLDLLIKNKKDMEKLEKLYEEGEI